MIEENVPKAKADEMVEAGARILELRGGDKGVFCTVEVPDKAEAPPKAEEPVATTEEV